MASEISQSEAFAPIAIAEPIAEEDDVERSTVIDEVSILKPNFQKPVDNRFPNS